MKKIVLGCAAVLLSLGLLAGCNNDAPIEEAVLINVDSSATVVVGDTLELPYTVSPEKAEVVAASDNEDIVTAEAQDGILYLQGASEGSAIVTLVGTYKKYAEANTNISVKVISEAEAEQEPGPETGGDGDGDTGTTNPGNTGAQYFGFEVNDLPYYIDGTTQSAGTYRGEITTSCEDAVEISVEKYEQEEEVENAYYMSFELGEETYYITIIEDSDHTNLSYATEPSLIYWNETNQCWGNADSSYFLCCNTTYMCLYASEVSKYISSSPIAEVIDATDVESLVITGASSVNIEETITLHAVANLGALNSVTWASSNDEIATVDSEGVVTGVAAGDVTITATSTINTSVKSEAHTVAVSEKELEMVTTGLTNGGTYYLTFEDSETLYYFDGGNWNNEWYLTASSDFDSAVEVTATGDDSNGYTLTFTKDETEYTIFGYLNNSYGELTCDTTANYGSSNKTSKTNLFKWDSDYNGLTITVSSTKTFVYGTMYQNSPELGLYTYTTDYANSHTWVHLYTKAQ